MLKKVFRVSVLLLLGGVLTGCVSTFPPAPLKVMQPEYQYVIGPGDTLDVFVWKYPELSASVPVRPDGRMDMPLVENLPASGKDTSALARDIENAMLRYIQNPVVTVIVTHFSGPTSGQIRVVGEAVKPKMLPYVEYMTLLDVMIAVEGVTASAAGNRAMILRTAEGNKQYSVRLKDLVKGGDMSANVEMRPGDILVIPQGWF